ncbi:anti-sigma factor [Glacieibacterium sp.]|uniref:anti-sigma factor n=1 Tax=Glacieibacterium sp. TaxID=2860237 RepID=UPI003AFF95AC
MSGQDFDRMDDGAPDDGAAFAADYALGALGAADRVVAERRMASDPAFRSEVEAWQAVLAPMAEDIAPVAPPPALWARIDAATRPVAATVPQLGSQSMWSSLNLWRYIAGASTVAAGIAVALLVARPPQPAQQPILVARLAASDGSGVITATYDAARGSVILTPAGKSDAAGKTPELWVIEGDKPPRSLGTIDISSTTSTAIPSERLRGLKEGSTLAISLEPKGGSTTGAPTGPIVATGKLTGI